jgi:hypothetical protein
MKLLEKTSCFTIGFNVRHGDAGRGISDGD